MLGVRRWNYGMVRSVQEVLPEGAERVLPGGGWFIGKDNIKNAGCGCMRQF